MEDKVAFIEECEVSSDLDDTKNTSQFIKSNSIASRDSHTKKEVIE